MIQNKLGLAVLLLPIVVVVGCFDAGTPSSQSRCIDDDDPAAHIVGYGEDCTRIRFTCDEGQVPFRDDCSCGCIDEPGGAGSADAFLECLDPDDPLVHYVGDVDQCAVIRFTCGEEQEMFFDDCGCGCVDLPSNLCHDADDPTVHYLGNAEECAAIRFACDDGQSPFWDECGCGCIDDIEPSGCHDPGDPAVRYVGDVDLCTRIRFVCEEDEEYFADDCGCGCIEL